jgi:hypothetical protein
MLGLRLRREEEMMAIVTSERRTAPEPAQAPQALRDPMGDKTWQEQAALALRAREMGEQLRRGKPKSFREIVGQI